MNPVLAALRDADHVSVSSIKGYLRCPQQHFFRYFSEVEPSHRNAALVVGRAVHDGLENFYRFRMVKNDDPPVELLVDSFSTSWKRGLIGDPPVRCDDLDAERDRGVELLKVFHEQAPRPARVLAVEEAFALNLKDPDTGGISDRLIVGAIDALAADEQGRTVIIESKTAARSWPPVQLVHDPQVTIYRMAVREMGVADDPVLQFHFLKKTKTPSFEVAEVIRTAEQELEVRRLFWQVLRAIDSQIVYPNRSWACGNCEYSHACNPGL